MTYMPILCCLERVVDHIVDFPITPLRSSSESSSVSPADEVLKSMQRKFSNSSPTLWKLNRDDGDFFIMCLTNAANQTITVTFNKKDKRAHVVITKEKREDDIRWTYDQPITDEWDFKRAVPSFDH